MEDDQPTIKLPEFQPRSGLLSRYHYEMLQRQQQAQAFDPVETEDLPRLDTQRMSVAEPETWKMPAQTVKRKRGHSHDVWLLVVAAEVIITLIAIATLVVFFNTPH